MQLGNSVFIHINIDYDEATSKGRVSSLDCRYMSRKLLRINERTYTSKWKKSEYALPNLSIVSVNNSH